MTAKDTINLAKHAVEEGADGIGVVTPSYFSFSDDGLVDYYVKISNSVPNNFPVYLYGIPQNAVNDLSYEAVKRIAEKCPNVVGIKYSYPNIMRILQFMTIRDNTFSVLVGSDALYQNVVSSGGDGSVCASAMIYSEYFEALYNALDKTDTIRAIAIQRKINELVAISARKCGIHAMKVILKNEGVIKCDTMRAPMDWLSEQDKEELLKDIADAEYRKVTI